jgi:hypothetical protein
LATLPLLANLNGERTELAELPTSGFSSLRWLNVLGTKVDATQVGAFRKAHPECRVIYEWERALADSLGRADRLVVYAGNTAGWMSVEGRQLYESKSASEVTELLGLIDVDERRSEKHDPPGWGSPILIFYRGQRWVGGVGMFWGRDLGWDGWPCNGLLTPEGAKSVAQWLLERGVTQPASELLNPVASSDARRRQETVFDEALEPAMKTALGQLDVDCPSVAQFIEAMAKVYPEPHNRILAMLRLVGAEPEVSWIFGNPYSDALCEEGLTKFESPELGAALVAAARSEDPRIVAGAARYFFRRKGRERFDAATQATLLPALAGWSVRSPRDAVRNRTVCALELIDNEGARMVLRQVAAENPAPRILAPNQVAEGGQWKEFGPGDGDVAEGTPVALHAVLCLARLGAAQAAELFAKVRPLAWAEDADAVAWIEAILGDPKLADADRKTSGKAPLGRKE